MPALVGSMGSCDRAQVVVVQATLRGHWKAVIQVTARGGLETVADM